MPFNDAQSSRPSGYLVLDYVYCDAGNYKSFGSAWFKGALTVAECEELISSFEGGEFFVAEQIGVPSLYAALFELGGGANEDDHAWHRFEGLRTQNEISDKDRPTGRAVGFLASCRAAKNNWRPEMSPNYDLRSGT